MIEMFEKAATIGIGALSLSQKKGEELLAELKERFGVSEEEGKALLERLKVQADETRQRLTEAAHEEVKKACERLGVVPREEFDKLRERIDELERMAREPRN